MAPFRIAVEKGIKCDFYLNRISSSAVAKYLELEKYCYFYAVTVGFVGLNLPNADS